MAKFSKAINLEASLVLTKDCYNRDFVYKRDGRTSCLEGDIIGRPIYEHFELIARNGSSKYSYDPEVLAKLPGQRLIVGGVLKKEDFARYEVRVETPLSAAYDIDG